MPTQSYSLSKEGVSAEKRLIPAGMIYEMHWHDYIELEVILSGSAEHIYNSEVYQVSEGHAYIVTHHDLHAFRAITDVVLINIRFNMDILDSQITNSLLYASGKTLCCSFSDGDRDRIYKSCNKLILELGEGKELFQMMAKLILSEIVIEIIRRSNGCLGVSPRLSQKALEYIHLNFREELSLSMMAERLEVTPNYLGRVFARENGVSFNVYINKLRLRHVCNMLLFSSFTVKEIAEMSGYLSLEYFFSVFKKYTGVTPSEYRRIYAKKLTESNVSTNSMLG